MIKETKFDIKSRGWDITLANKVNGNEVSVVLFQPLEKEKETKWVVRGKGYQGYFGSLERAFDEAVKHLQYRDKMERADE